MSLHYDADPLLRRLERRALVFCAAAAVVALLVPGGGPDVALGIAGGGALIGISYWAIRSSIDGLLALMGPGASPAPEGEQGPGTPRGSGRGGAARHVIRFTTRYLVLGVLAYLMLVRFRLHPIGLIVGVSSIVVAATVEALAGVTGRRGR